METALKERTRILNWGTLLRLAVISDIAILLYMVITLQDTLALGLAVIGLVGLGLLRWRNGVFGIIVTGLLSADIAIWTVSGALSNFINGEQISALILPAFLGLVSLVGATSAVATWAVRKDPDKGDRFAKITAQSALGLLLLVLIASFFARPSQTAVANPGDIALKTENMQYSQRELVTKNGQLTVQISNEDLWWHTFTIDELDVDLKVPMGAQRSLTFEAPPGEYRFYCTIPGHEAAGMHGTITIEAQE